MQLRSRRVILARFGVAALGLAAACHRPTTIVRLPDAGTPAAEVVATAMIPPDAVFPALRGTKFGGVSGLAYDRSHDELLGLSDDTENSRVFRMKYLEEPFRVVPVDVTLLQRTAPAPAKLDPEGLALLPSGDLLVSSEGFGDTEPRVPPAIIEYRRDGHFVRQLPIPAEFVPPERGPFTQGVPNNQGFESLALTPDGRRLWTGVETSLVQDGGVATVGRGSRARLLEYTLEGATFVPSREYVYDVDPLPPATFPRPGMSVSGLSELLAINDRELIAVERAWVQNTDSAIGDVYRVRIYRVTIDGSPVAVGERSIAGRADIKPVTKTLLLDLASSKNLPRALAGLDNFEGLAVIPTRAPRRYEAVPSLQKPVATAVLVSDDNFDRSQRTWFVKVAFDAAVIP